MRTLNKNLRRARRPAPKAPPAPAPSRRPAASPSAPQAARPSPSRARVLRPWDVPRELTWYVHAHGPTVRANKESGLNYPLVLIRRSDRLQEMVIARHVELPGPSRLAHRHSQPLPETENNAIAVMETTTAPVAYFDPPGSHIALATDVPPSSCVRAVLDDAEWTKRAQRATHRIPR